MKTSILSMLSAALLLPLSAHAAELTASDRTEYDNFGYSSAALSGGIGLIGTSIYSDGSAYVFRDLDTATGAITESVKLTALGGTANAWFGTPTALSGGIGLVGAESADSYAGSAYVFRDLDTATGTITESVKLTASDRASYDYFGASTALSGSLGLVGAKNHDGSKGSAYLFRGLDTATGAITETLKLTATDSSTYYGYFGVSVSLSGSTALVGSLRDTSYKGSAYVFRDLDTATGDLTETLKLTATDDDGVSYFGVSVSLSGGIGLVGASGNGNYYSRGSAYVFRDLDTATGAITESVKLTASDAAAYAVFGTSVSLSGGTGLVGDPANDSSRGSAYLFRGLDAATGSVTEDVKLTASDSEEHDTFGRAVGLDGDTFLISAYGKDFQRGKAYTGSVSSVTTLDKGNAARTISGISFKSQGDWIIGQTTDNNAVLLSAGDTANVTATGKAVYIGKNAGSDSNALIVAGALNVHAVSIGSTAGNSGNTLQIEDSASLTLDTFRLAAGNTLGIKGSYAGINDLLGWLGDANLEVWTGRQWQVVNDTNYTSLITITESDGYTNVQAEPPTDEPEPDEPGPDEPTPSGIQILTQPQAQLRYNGETANFSVVATGEGVLKYQWYFNGKKIGGATKSTYSVKTAAAKVGVYKVIVSNAEGSETSNEVALTMRPAAYWSWSDESSVTPKVNPGASVDFSVAGTVEGPAGAIKYQWMKDGKPVKNATGETLTLANATLADAGLYTLVITTSAGKVTTAPRRLIVKDETFLVYSIKGPGSYVSATSTKQALTMAGFLLVDRKAKSAAIVWVDAKAKTFQVENYEDLSVESTGPSVGTVTALRSFVSNGGEDTTLWLTGTDVLVALDKTTKTLAPSTMLGVLDVLKDLGATVGVRAQNASLALDKVKTLRTRASQDWSVADEVARITGELPGYTDAGALVTETRDVSTDNTFLVYAIQAPGRIATATSNAAYTAGGFLLVDRAAGRGAMVWINAKAKTYAVEIRENLAMKTPGDLPGALTALKAIEFDGTDDDTVWLTGVSALNKLDKTITTVAPTTMTGVLNALRLSGALEIQTQKATLTLDKARTLRTRTGLPVSLEAEVARITGALTGYTNITP